MCERLTIVMLIAVRSCPECYTLSLSLKIIYSSVKYKYLMSSTYRSLVWLISHKDAGKQAAYCLTCTGNKTELDSYASVTFCATCLTGSSCVTHHDIMCV